VFLLLCNTSLQCSQFIYTQQVVRCMDVLLFGSSLKSWSCISRSEAQPLCPRLGQPTLQQVLLACERTVRDVHASCTHDSALHLSVP